MSSFEIFTGRWRNYSLGSANVEQVTLSTFLSVLLIAGISTFITIVGVQFWTIIAFVIHQNRARPGPHDGWHHLQQAAYKNSGSPLAAAWTLFKASFTYAGRKSWWNWRRHAPPYVTKRKRRAARSILTPIVAWALFIAIGLLAPPLITHPAYKGNEVKAKKQNCGFEQWNTTQLDGMLAFEQFNIRAATEAVVYVNACYNTTDSTSCFTLPQQKLSYSTIEGGECPFGDRCKAPPVVMDTGWLDSHQHFGINAPVNERIQFRKQTTCAVVDVQDLTRLIPIGNGLYSHEYNLGPVTNYSPGFTTYALERQAFDYVGYDIQPYYAFLGAENNWIPIPDFSPTDGDVGLFVIRFGVIQYQTPVTDPLFSANNQTTELDQIRYTPDDVAGLVACIDRYQLQDPGASIKTELGSLVQVRNQFQKLGFNNAQLAAGTRLILPSFLSGMYNAVNGLGTAALRAQHNVFSDVSTGLPPTQWQTEVTGWFETTLAMLQRKVVAYASKSSSELHPLMTLGTTLTTSRGVDLTPSLTAMCSEQKLRNIAHYQTFSLLGLVVIAGAGAAVILVSLTQELLDAALWHALGCIHRAKPAPNLRLVQWTMDSVYQYQRQAYQNAGQGAWERCTDDIPAVRGDLEMLGLDGETPGYRPLGDRDREMEMEMDELEQ